MASIEESEHNGVVKLPTNLVDTAVEFLSNPKIVNQPEHQKISFLKKKGLDDEQISTALNRSMGTVRDLTTSRLAPSIPPHIIAPRNTWDKVRDTTNTVICLSGIFFGCKYIYKYYIGPYLTGIQPKSERDTIIEVQQSMMSVLVQIQNTLEKMDRTMDLHGNTLKNNAFSDSSQISQALKEMRDSKAEINSLKGLLINRQNFPVPPIPSASIPKWQSLQKKSDETTSISTNSINSFESCSTSAIQSPCEDSSTLSTNGIDEDGGQDVESCGGGETASTKLDSDQSVGELDNPNNCG